MFDPNVYNQLAEDCLEYCKKNPKESSSYNYVSGKFVKSLNEFVVQMTNGCKDILTKLDSELTYVKNNEFEISDGLFDTETLIESTSRCRLGTLSLPIPSESYTHYENNYSKISIENKYSKLTYNVSELKSLSNLNELQKGKKFLNRRSFFAKDITVDDEVAKPVLDGIVSKSISTRVFNIGKTSSFWNPMNPENLEIKISYPTTAIAEMVQNTDVPKNIATLTHCSISNSENLKNFADRDIFNRVDSMVLSTPGISIQNLGDGDSAHSSKGSDAISKRNSDVVENTKKKHETRSSRFFVRDLLNDNEIVPVSIELNEDTKNEPEGNDNDYPKVKALYDYQANDENEMSFQAGDIIKVLQMNDNGWDLGELDGVKGFFPRNFVTNI